MSVAWGKGREGDVEEAVRVGEGVALKMLLVESGLLHAGGRHITSVPLGPDDRVVASFETDRIPSSNCIAHAAFPPSGLRSPHHFHHNNEV